jgi:hypothetical protein
MTDPTRYPARRPPAGRLLVWRLGPLGVLGALVTLAATSEGLAADSPAVIACRSALQAVQLQPGYAARYKANIRKTGSDPFEQEGTAVRQGDLLYREGRRPGEREAGVRIFQRGKRIATYDVHSEQWLTPDQIGDSTVGRGLEDPNEAMAFLLQAMDDATPGAPTEKVGDVECRPYAVRIDKRQLARKVQQQFQSAQNLDWQKAEVNAQMLLGGDPLLPRLFRINGVLPDQNKPEVCVTLHIEVRLERYGADKPLEVPKDAKEILEQK